MTDLVLLWIFAQAAAPAITSSVVSSVLTAVVTAPATVAAIRFLDARAKAREDAARALVDAERARALAEIQADAATRRAEEEEQTGRHEIDQPIAERMATAERAERIEVQRKLDEMHAVVRDLDRALASANEQVRVLREQVESLTETVRAQAEAIVRAHADNEKLLDWIDEHLPDAGHVPRPGALPRAIEVVCMPVAKRDPRRE